MTALPQKISAKILAVCLVTFSFWKNYLSALQELSIYRAILQPCFLTNLCFSSNLIYLGVKKKIYSLKEKGV